MRVKILIIEDDPAWSLFVESIIDESDYELVGSANTLIKAKALIEGYRPHVIIGNIRIQNSTIFELWDEGNKYEFSTIFMSSHLDNEFFLLSKQFPKSTYLVKPFHKFSLLSTLDLLLSKYPIVKPIDEKFIPVRGNQQQIKKIKFDEITWIEAKGNYCFINTQSHKKYARKKSLKSLINELDSRFIRIHKAFLINTEYINRVELSNNLIIVRETAIPLGRHYRKELDGFLEKR